MMKTTSSPIISIQNVRFAYDATPVLDDFSYDIHKGEFLCITGESGCGKSTLLRLINGLLIPQEGQIIIDGVVPNKNNITSLRRHMGYILQENSLFPHLTVYQNMTYCLDLIQADKAFVDMRIRELLPLVNLDEGLLRQYPDQLSGGQKQRVGIVRAIAHQPHIILMDEPFSALDPVTRAQLQDLVKTIHQRTHTTFIMVTHSQEEAEKLGSEILKM